MKVLFVPDIHIGKGINIGKDAIGVGLNSRVEDQKNNLNFILEYAKSNNVKHMFLLGDIWEDINPKSSLVRVFFSWVQQVMCANIDLHIIMGNHDFVRTGRERVSMLDSLKELKLIGVNIISDISEMTIENTQFVFLPFTDRRQLEVDTIGEAIDIVKEKINNIRSASKISVLLGHMALEGSLWVGDEIDQSANEIFLPLNAVKDYNMVCMGHIHNYQILNSKDPFVCHVGSLDKTSFGEKDKLVIMYDTVNYKYEGKLLPCRNLIEINVSIPVENKNSTDYIIEYIDNEIKVNKASYFKDSIVRIKSKLNAHDCDGADKEKISKYLNDLGVFHLASFIEIRNVDKVIVKNIEIDEKIDATKAVDIFSDTIDTDKQFKVKFVDLCKLVIKHVDAKEKI